LFAPSDIDRLTHFWQRSIAVLAAGLVRAGDDAERSDEEERRKWQ
jgi:hypothetical protein